MPDTEQTVLDRAYERALAFREHETRDICEQAVLDALGEAGEPHPEFVKAAKAPEGATIIGGGRVLKEIRGMGKVYDWRTSPWTPANGGRITPLVLVHHIPVVPNMAGIADFVRLRDVLVAQGLMVQSADDREGNVALFTPFDILCYHARGANQLSCGIEHMHYTVGESWTKRQLRASAWQVQLAQRKHKIRRVKARLAAGDGVVRVTRRGQTTHQAVSAKAGYHDRSDPGPGYDFAYVRHCVRFFEQHGHFHGA